MKTSSALCLLMVLALGGCIPDHWPQKWLDLTKDAPATPEPPMPQWCYKTLAQIDCYDKPHPEAAARLVTPPPPRVLSQPEAVEKIDADQPAPVPLHNAN